MPASCFTASSDPTCCRAGHISPMSQIEHRTVKVTGHEEANCRDPLSNLSQIAQIQRQKSEFTDSSEPLFDLYCNLTGYYTKRVEGKIRFIDNVVIFMSLFSALITSLLSVTVSDVKPDPQYMSAYYLENIYNLQVLANLNGSHPLTAAQSSRFSPPTYAVWANALLLMSLCLSIFTALLALSIRRHVPYYLLRAESPQFSSHDRARTRKFLPNGKIRWRRLH
ncbi:hypothetical protein BGW80DRAFT_276602 [Lactifluus volemus]|nr:hypothetical protein BGW80DRAFT_276602 [Lactifluus volemus]